MKLPVLVIEGADLNLTCIVRNSMKSAGFQIEPCEPENALLMANDQLVLMIWISPRPVPQMPAYSETHELTFSRIDPMRMYANVEMFCSESMPDLVNQINDFIGMVRAGKFSTTPLSHAWFGFPSPLPMVYDWATGQHSYAIPA